MSDVDSPRYDLEERTFLFAKKVHQFVRHLPWTICNIEDVNQLVRASGSQGANYLEGNEALSKRDFRLRLKISRKEAKESLYWLKLVDVGSNPEVDRERNDLMREATELMKIFGAIVRKCE